MRTQEIRRTEWTNFLDGFSRLHRGWLVSIEIVKADRSVQETVANQPLLGITTGGGGLEEKILLTVGQPARQRVTGYPIRGAEHILIDRTEEGAVAGLEFDARDGSRTRLTLRNRIIADFLDEAVE